MTRLAWANKGRAAVGDRVSFQVWKRDLTGADRCDLVGFYVGHGLQAVGARVDVHFSEMGTKYRIEVTKETEPESRRQC